MLYQEFYIGKYDWKVCVFYDTTKEDTDEVMEYLFHIGCDGITAQRAYQNLSSNEPNTGLTYSRGGNTCIVLGYATDRGNFAHTYVHEITHCAIHIARATGVDFESEELAYIAGDLAEVMLPFASKFMCACCDNNKQLNNYDYE